MYYHSFSYCRLPGVWQCWILPEACDLEKQWWLKKSPHIYVLGNGLLQNTMLPYMTDKTQGIPSLPHTHLPMRTDKAGQTRPNSHSLPNKWLAKLLISTGQSEQNVRYPNFCLDSLLSSSAWTLVQPREAWASKQPSSPPQPRHPPQIGLRVKHFLILSGPFIPTHPILPGLVNSSL